MDNRKIRVLVADDSAFMRHAIATKVLNAPDIEVVGTARDGQDAVDQADRLRPDVITLDVEMPRLNGLDALREIMRRRPIPVVMLSSLTQAGAETTIRALELGALDFVAKPSGAISLDIQAVRDELLEKVRHAARAGARGLLARRSAAPAPVTVRPPGASPPRPLRAGANLVVIGASTGGPRALREVTSLLRADESTAYLLVQHMPAGFTKPLAERLSLTSELTIKEAQPGDRPAPGFALMAPGDYHLWLDRLGRIELGQGPRRHGVRPSIDITLESVARSRPRNLLAVILTGMGVDGALGCGAVRAAGGQVIAEHESTCVVYGMPRAVIEAGHATQIVPLDKMADAIQKVIESWNRPPRISTGSSFSAVPETSRALI